MLFIVLTFNLMAGLQLTDCFGSVKAAYEKQVHIFFVEMAYGAD